MILTLKTDNPVTEIGLVSEIGSELTVKKTETGNRLSVEILSLVADLVKTNGGDWSDLKGVVVFAGPGSFTGLRIGVTVANTIAQVLAIPVVAANGRRWVYAGIADLAHARSGLPVVPDYGGPANITKPRK